MDTVNDISLEVMDQFNKLDDSTDRLISIRYALARMSIVDGVSQEIVTPFKNALPEHIALESFTKSPSHTNLESFRTVLSELASSIILEMLVSVRETNASIMKITKLVPVVSTDVTLDFSKEYDLEQLAELSESLKSEYTLLSEEALFTPSPAMLDILTNEKVMYSDILNLLIDLFERMNTVKESTYSEYVDILDQSINSLCEVDNIICGTSNAILNAFGNPGTVTISSVILGKQAEPATREFDLVSILELLKTGESGTGALQASMTAGKYDRDAVIRRMTAIGTELTIMEDGFNLSDKQILDELKITELVEKLSLLFSSTSEILGAILEFLKSRTAILNEQAKYIAIIRSTMK